VTPLARAAHLLPFLALVAACEPAVPERDCSTCVYDFADTVPPAKALVFHWPASRQPVRFYGDPRGAMPTLVTLGVTAWEGQFLYGEFRGTITADSSQADVIMSWAGGVPPDVPPDPGPPVDACFGLTTNPAGVFVDSSSSDVLVDTSVKVLHITLGARGSFPDAAVAACLRRVVIHELGHALGLLKHSASSFDIMNATPTVTAPSATDRNTVEVLYHTPATVVPPPR
jgi:hypothetical protein